MEPRDVVAGWPGLGIRRGLWRYIRNDSAQRLDLLLKPLVVASDARDVRVHPVSILAQLRVLIADPLVRITRRLHRGRRLDLGNWDALNLRLDSGQRGKLLVGKDRQRSALGSVNRGVVINIARYRWRGRGGKSCVN